MTTSSTSGILQQAFILATGTAASDSMLAYLEALVEQGGGGYGLVAQQIDAYMGGVEAAQGTVATVKALALNGLGMVLSDAEAAAAKAELAAAGIDTWSKIFEFCINLQGTPGLVLGNRADAAQAFDVALELQGKAGLFSGATVEAAVKEMLQNIGSSGTSLQNGIAGLDAIAGNLSASGLQAAAVDGSIAGATVFVDADGNGRLSAGEYSTVTDSAGHFEIPAGTAPGALIVSGGTDLLTGEAFKGVLTAPAGSIVVNPFTSAIQALMAGHVAGTVQQATGAIQQALGLPAGINLLSYDPIAVLASSTASASEKAVALAVEAKALELANVMSELTAAIDAANRDGSSSAASVATALASAIWTSAASNNGLGTIDLTNVSVLTGIVQSAASAAGSTRIASHAAEVAQVIAASNQAAATATTPWELAQVAVVSQGATVYALAASGASGAFNALVADFTGASLAAQIDAAVPGYLALGVPVPVTLSATTMAAAALNSLDAASISLVDASTITTLTGTAADVSAAYASAGITGLGDEAVILSDTTLVAATLNTIDAATTGLVDASAATTLTGSAAEVKAAYASSGITGLGDEAVTLSDTTLTAAALNTIDAATSGTVNASTVTSLMDTAANVAAAYASTGISGLGNEAVKLTDTTLAAAPLVAIDAATTGAIDATTATTLTGTAANVAAAYASSGITGLGNEAVTLSDTTLAVATLNTIDAATTGLVNATAATTLTGTAAAVTAAYASAGITGLGGNEALTLSDTTLAAATLNTLDAMTTGAVNAGAVTTLTGTAAEVSTAYAAGGITGLGNEAVTLSDTTLAAATLNTIDAATSGSVNASTITTLTGAAAAVAAAYASAGITGLGNEAVTLSDTTLAAAPLDAIDLATSGMVDASAATTLTGTASAVAAAYASAGISGLGNEAVTLSDATLAAATLNAIDAATSGLVDASAATTLTGTAANVSTAQASVGITGLGAEAVTLSDTTLAALTLNGVDALTTGVVNAGAVTTLTGLAGDVNAAYTAFGAGTISGLGNEAVTLSDTTLAAATLSGIDALTSGAVNASSLTALSGTASEVATAYGSAGITGLGNEAVTLSDATLAAAQLDAIDLATSGMVDASAATTLTGTAANVATAYASAGITGLGDEAVTLSGTPLAAATLNTIDAATTGLVDASAAATLTGTAANVLTAHASAGITGLGGEAVTLSDTTLTALTLNGVDGYTSGVVDATLLTTLTGDFAGIALAMGSAGITKSAGINVTMTDTAANLTAQTFAAAGASDALHVGVAGAATDLTALTGFETITLAGSTSTSADTVSIADGAGTAVSATGAVGVVLGSGGQAFTGSAGADVIVGGSGADTITGGDGADTITGGAGHDTIHLSDSDGAFDVVVIDSASNADADTISGFVSGQDVLDFSIAGLGLNGADYSAGAATSIDAATAAGLGAGTWSNYVVVDTAANIAALVTTGATGAVLAVATDTGNISWDADGDFSAGAVIVGTASGASASGDFAIIA